MSDCFVLRCQRCGSSRRVGAWREPSTPGWSLLCGDCKLAVTFRAHPWLSIMAGRDEGAAATHATTKAGNRGVGQTSGASSSVPATESSPAIPVHPTAVEPASPRSIGPGRGASSALEAA